MLRFYQVSIIISFITTALGQFKCWRMTKKLRPDLLDKINPNFLGLLCGVFIPLYNLFWIFVNLVSLFGMKDDDFLKAMETVEQEEEDK